MQNQMAELGQQLSNVIIQSQPVGSLKECSEEHIKCGTLTMEGERNKMQQIPADLPKSKTSDTLNTSSSHSLKTSKSNLSKKTTRATQFKKNRIFALSLVHLGEEAVDYRCTKAHQEKCTKRRNSSASKEPSLVFVKNATPSRDLELTCSNMKDADVSKTRKSNRREGELVGGETEGTTEKNGKMELPQSSSKEIRNKKIGRKGLSEITVSQCIVHRSEDAQSALSRSKASPLGCSSVEAQKPSRTFEASKSEGYCSARPTQLTRVPASGPEETDQDYPIVSSQCLRNARPRGNIQVKGLKVTDKSYSRRKPKVSSDPQFDSKGADVTVVNDKVTEDKTAVDGQESKFLDAQLEKSISQVENLASQKNENHSKAFNNRNNFTHGNESCPDGLKNKEVIRSRETMDKSVTDLNQKSSTSEHSKILPDHSEKAERIQVNLPRQNMQNDIASQTVQNTILQDHLPNSDPQYKVSSPQAKGCVSNSRVVQDNVKKRTLRNNSKTKTRASRVDKFVPGFIQSKTVEIPCGSNWDETVDSEGFFFQLEVREQMLDGINTIKSFIPRWYKMYELVPSDTTGERQEYQENQETSKNSSRDNFLDPEIIRRRLGEKNMGRLQKKVNEEHLVKSQDVGLLQPEVIQEHLVKPIDRTSGHFEGSKDNSFEAGISWSPESRDSKLYIEKRNLSAVDAEKRNLSAVDAEKRNLSAVEAEVKEMALKQFVEEIFSDGSNMDTSNKQLQPNIDVDCVEAKTIETSSAKARDLFSSFDSVTEACDFDKASVDKGLSDFINTTYLEQAFLESASSEGFVPPRCNGGPGNNWAKCRLADVGCECYVRKTQDKDRPVSSALLHTIPCKRSQNRCRGCTREKRTSFSEKIDGGSKHNRRMDKVWQGSVRHREAFSKLSTAEADGRLSSVDEGWLCKTDVEIGAKTILPCKGTYPRMNSQSSSFEVGQPQAHPDFCSLPPGVAARGLSPGSSAESPCHLYESLHSEAYCRSEREVANHYTRQPSPFRQPEFDVPQQFDHGETWPENRMDYSPRDHWQNLGPQADWQNLGPQADWQDLGPQADWQDLGPQADSNRLASAYPDVLPSKRPTPISESLLHNLMLPPPPPPPRPCLQHSPHPPRTLSPRFPPSRTSTITQEPRLTERPGPPYAESCELQPGRYHPPVSYQRSHPQWEGQPPSEVGDGSWRRRSGGFRPVPVWTRQPERVQQEDQSPRPNSVSGAGSSFTRMDDYNIRHQGTAHEYPHQLMGRRQSKKQFEDEEFCGQEMKSGIIRKTPGGPSSNSCQDEATVGCPFKPSTDFKASEVTLPYEAPVESKALSKSGRMKLLIESFDGSEPRCLKSPGLNRISMSYGDDQPSESSHVDNGSDALSERKSKKVLPESKDVAPAKDVGHIPASISTAAHGAFQSSLGGRADPASEEPALDGVGTGHSGDVSGSELEVSHPPGDAEKLSDTKCGKSRSDVLEWNMTPRDIVEGKIKPDLSGLGQNGSRHRGDSTPEGLPSYVPEARSISSPCNATVEGINRNMVKSALVGNYQKLTPKGSALHPTGEVVSQKCLLPPRKRLYDHMKNIPKRAAEPSFSIGTMEYSGDQNCIIGDRALSEAVHSEEPPPLLSLKENLDVHDIQLKVTKNQEINMAKGSHRREPHHTLWDDDGNVQTVLKVSQVADDGVPESWEERNEGSPQHEAKQGLQDRLSMEDGDLPISDSDSEIEFSSRSLQTPEVNQTAMKTSDAKIRSQKVFSKRFIGPCPVVNNAGGKEDCKKKSAPDWFMNNGTNATVQSEAMPVFDSWQSIITPQPAQDSSVPSRTTTPKSSPGMCCGSLGRVMRRYSTLSSDPETTSPLGDSRLKRTRWSPAVQNDNVGGATVEPMWKTYFKKRYQQAKVPFIDTHCHLDFLFKRSGFRGTFIKYRKVNEDTFPPNYGGCVAVFCDPRTFNKSGGLWKDMLTEETVWGAIGCHPKCAGQFDTQAEENLKAMLKHSKVVALGEIGLDYSGTFFQHRDLQMSVFRRQIKIALEDNLPLVIHCRDAEDDCIRILEELVPRNHRIHRHCFTGSWAEAEQWLHKFTNSFIGLTPLVTFRGGRSAGPRQVAANLPLDKLLLETDAPYFVPHRIPREEMTLSHPGMAITVAAEVATLSNNTLTEVLEACRENTRAMYGI